MRFEWDERKSASNFRKHGIRFATAEQVFLDPLVSFRQERYVNGEERWTAIGSSVKSPLIASTSACQW